LTRTTCGGTIVTSATTTVPKRTVRYRREFLAYLMVAPPFLVMALLIIYPALLAVFDTLFVKHGGIRRLSLSSYSQFFATPLAVTNLLFTLQITFITVVCLFIFCLPISLYLRFVVSRVSGAVQILALFPMFVPGIIAAYGLIRFMGANGWLERMLEVILGFEGYESPYLRPSGIVIGLVWEGIPITVLILTAGLSQVSNALLETARDVGANRWQVFWRIILPLVKRPFLIVFTLNFLAVFGSFTIPYLLGPASPQMMGVYMRRTFYDSNLPNQAQVQAVLTFAVSAVVSILYVRAVVSEKIQENV
jgi:ABC-type spermidine/putrescine transport system permease subunit I